MRGIIACILLLVALASTASADDSLALSLPNKCEDVLPADYCERLRQVASKVKAKASEVEQAVTSAVKNGAQTASEIYDKALDFFRTRVQSLTCVDVLSAERCNRIQAAASLIHAKAGEVNEAVRQAVLKGVQTSKDLYANAVDFFKNRIQTLTCADVLTTEKCTRLENIAVVVKAKSNEVSASVQTAVLKAFESSQDVYASAVDFFKNRVHKLTCQDVLSSEQCNKLTVIAGNLKGKFSEGEEKLRAAILSGKAKAEELYQTAVDFFKKNVANKKCEDLMDQAQCDQLKALSNTLRLKTSEFRTHVVNALSTGVQTTKNAFETVKEFLKTKVSCEALLSNKTCSSMRNIASRLQLTVAEVDRIVREAVVNGITKASEFYKKALDYLTSKILGNSDSSRLRRSILPDSIRQAILDKIAKAKEMARLAVQKCLDAFKIADVKLRGVIERAVLDGKMRLAQVKEALKMLMDKMIAGDTDAVAAIARHRRDLKEDMKTAASKVRGALKVIIKKLLEQSNDALLAVRNYIESILAQVKDGRVTRSTDNEFNDLQQTVDELVKSQLDDLVDEADAKAETLIQESIEANERDLDVITDSLKHSIERRDVGNDLTDLAMQALRIKVKLILNFLGGIFGDNTKQALDKFIKDNQTELEAAAKKGFNAILKVVMNRLAVIG